MKRTGSFYIDGRWVEPLSTQTIALTNPASEEAYGSLSLGGSEDVDRAVAAALGAFDAFAQTTRAERVELLRAVISAYEARMDDFAEVVTAEMGAPCTLARTAHVPAGLSQLRSSLAALESFAFEAELGTTQVVHEPIGVCGLITPWNWPLNQIAAKVGPALAAGCTMVLKPSEIAPLSALALAEILDSAGVPAGVFNLVNGDGPGAGAALSAHPDVDMVSFTGSTRAGIDVAMRAAPTVKRVHQELGGNSADVILDDADLEAVLARDVARAYRNSGQSCNTCSRVLVPADWMDDAVRIARDVTERVVVGPPEAARTEVGPVASEAQFRRVQALLERAIADGATVVAGGPGRPPELPVGYYVRPTVLAGVTGDMEISREEIFGPVIRLIAYRDEGEALRIANDDVYGLSGMVSSRDPQRARAFARRMRTGMVHLNGAPVAGDAPFGGYRRSGNGREYGTYGLSEFLEAKSIYGGVH